MYRADIAIRTDSIKNLFKRFTLTQQGAIKYDFICPGYGMLGIILVRPNDLGTFSNLDNLR